MFIVSLADVEPPGGYMDDCADPVAAAARGVEEEGGWRPRTMEFVVSCQQIIGNLDFLQDLCLGVGRSWLARPPRWRG